MTDVRVKDQLATKEFPEGYLTKKHSSGHPSRKKRYVKIEYGSDSCGAISAINCWICSSFAYGQISTTPCGVSSFSTTRVLSYGQGELPVADGTLAAGAAAMTAASPLPELIV